MEVFPAHHESLEDFLATLRAAFLYAKTVTLGLTEWPETNEVMARNRRIGTSLTGITQFVANRGLDTLRIWCKKGYRCLKECDQDYSGRFGIPLSIKITTVKPSGTVSLLGGATSGVHFPESRFIIRRVRISKLKPMLKKLQKAGYHVEADVTNPKVAVVSFPVDYGEGVRSAASVSIWEQLLIAAFLQRYWSDNQVSATVTFDPKTEGDQIAHALKHYQHLLKSISFLPRLKAGAYKQMPLEAITEAQYEDMVSRIEKIDWNAESSEPVADARMELFCTSDVCVLVSPENAPKSRTKRARDDDENSSETGLKRLKRRPSRKRAAEEEQKKDTIKKKRKVASNGQ